MNELLRLALQAHGGLERWREVESLNVRVMETTRDATRLFEAEAESGAATAG